MPSTVGRQRCNAFVIHLNRQFANSKVHYEKIAVANTALTGVVRVTGP
jgi:hypothetical protein